MVDGLSSAIPGIHLRPVAPGDHEFLLAVFRATREDELALTDWTEPEKSAFIDMQFRAQDGYYHEVYPDGRFLVVTRRDERIGRLYLTRLPDEMRIIDLALMPSARGQGIGTSLIAAVVAEADAVAIPVRLHVEPWNPAKRLYERLGFQTLEMRGMYELMERPPAVRSVS